VGMLLVVSRAQTVSINVLQSRCDVLRLLSLRFQEVVFGLKLPFLLSVQVVRVLQSMSKLSCSLRA
jgi:hypothetical protein